MDKGGIICCSCDEWFDVTTSHGVDVAYCPICGHEFTEDEFSKMVDEADFE